MHTVHPPASTAEPHATAPVAAQPLALARTGVAREVRLGLQALHRCSPLLVGVGLGLLVLSVVTWGLTLADARQFQGVSLWLKPWKFQVSAALYFWTLALFMVWLPQAALRTWAVRYVVWAAVISGLFEVGYITWQAAQGQASHYNVTTPFHAAMYTAMGVMAVVLTSASAVLGVVIARSAHYRLAPALKLSVVLGLLSTFVLGTAFGAYLGSQTTGHWVGGALTDAGGLPLVKWSRTGGDLRVAHFVGIHAMHFLPAFGALCVWLLEPQRWSTGTQWGARAEWAEQAVWAFAGLFAAGTTWTFVQALRGEVFLGT
jgi:hypothetical protein